MGARFPSRCGSVGQGVRGCTTRPRRGEHKVRDGYLRPLLGLLGLLLFAVAAILVTQLDLAAPDAGKVRAETTDPPPPTPPVASRHEPRVEERRDGGRPPRPRDVPPGPTVRTQTTLPPGRPTETADHPAGASTAEPVEVSGPAETSQPAAAPVAGKAETVAKDEPPEAPPREGPAEETGEEAPIRRNLSGWVFDEAGEPVAGLEVGAVARRLMPASAAAATGDSRRHSTTTNPNGHFGFLQLLDGEYELRTAATEQYEPATAMVRAGVDAVVLVVTAKTGRAVFVHGLVESSRGERLAGVRVIPLARPASAAMSDPQGFYELRLPVDGRRRGHTFRFVRNGYRDLRLVLAASELAGVEDIRLDARLEPVEGQTRVTGTVVGSDGDAVRGALVELYSAALLRRETATTDRQGGFTFRTVQFGSDYRLWVRPRRDYRDYVEEGLVVGAAGRDLAIVVEALDLAALRGQMVDPAGRPVPGVTLWLRTAHEGSQRVSAVTGGRNGEFAVDRIPEGPLTLQTFASPYFSFSGIRLPPGVITRVRLVLDTGSHQLDGFVLDPDGTPVPGAQVSLRWSSGEGGVLSRSNRRTTTDAGGYFLFTQLGSGRHTLTASAAGYRGARLEPQVGAGGSEVRIQLQEDPG